jgi:hypothetical protein
VLLRIGVVPFRGNDVGADKKVLIARKMNPQLAASRKLRIVEKRGFSFDCFQWVSRQFPDLENALQKNNNICRSQTERGWFLKEFGAGHELVEKDVPKEFME